MTRRTTSRAFGLLASTRRRSTPIDTGDLVHRAEQILEFRARRAKAFGRTMFGEPAWDILLAIYIGEQRGDCPAIAKLTGCAGVAPSVALRWLNFLIGEGLVERDVHRANLDAIVVHLTPGARETLERYLTEAFSVMGGVTAAG